MWVKYSSKPPWEWFIPPKTNGDLGGSRFRLQHEERLMHRDQETQEMLREERAHQEDARSRQLQAATRSRCAVVRHWCKIGDFMVIFLFQKMVSNHFIGNNIYWFMQGFIFLDWWPEPKPIINVLTPCNLTKANMKVAWSLWSFTCTRPCHGWGVGLILFFGPCHGAY